MLVLRPLNPPPTPGWAFQDYRLFSIVISGYELFFSYSEMRGNPVTPETKKPSRTPEKWPDLKCAPFHAWLVLISPVEIEGPCQLPSCHEWQFAL